MALKGVLKRVRLPMVTILKNDGVVKTLHLLRCAPRRKCPWGTIFLSLRRTLVRRNDRKNTRLGYEAFYLAI
jgi:hypothetical protein